MLYALFGTPYDPHVAGPVPGLDLQEGRDCLGPCLERPRTGVQRGAVPSALRPLPRHQRRRHGPDRGRAASLSARLSPWAVQIQAIAAGRRADRPTTWSTSFAQGANGTAMPSFNLLPEGEIAALVEYVEYLSMRGQTEIGLIGKYERAGEPTNGKNWPRRPACGPRTARRPRTSTSPEG